MPRSKAAALGETTAPLIWDDGPALEVVELPALVADVVAGPVVVVAAGAAVDLELALEDGGLPAVDPIVASGLFDRYMVRLAARAGDRVLT